MSGWIWRGPYICVCVFFYLLLALEYYLVYAALEMRSHGKDVYIYMRVHLCVNLFMEHKMGRDRYSIMEMMRMRTREAA